MKSLTLNIIMCKFVIMIILTTIHNSFAQLPSSDPAYQLVFSDEFTGSMLDSTKWLKRYPWHQSSNYQKFWCDTATPVPMAAIKVRDSNGYIDTTNCKLSGGTLKLITKKENYYSEVWNYPKCSSDSCHNDNNNNYGSWHTDICGSNYSDTLSCFDRDNLQFNYTTAMLFSKFDFRYGYFEIRFKLPALPPSPKTYKGHGGTFWLFSGNYNDWSEIDAFEINAYDANTGNYYQTGCNTHFREKNPQNSTNTHDTTHFTEGIPQYSPGFQPNTWHTVGMNWTSTAIDFYVDGARQYTAHNHPDSLQPMAIIINCGGLYTPLDNYCVPFDTASANGTHFPYTYEIDYVKVWQPKKDCDTTVNLTSFNPATYDNKLHKSVIMGTNVNISNQSNQSFWGADYIQINEGTTVDNQSNVLFNVTNCNNIDTIRKIPVNTRTPEYILPPPASFLDKINN